MATKPELKIETVSVPDTVFEKKRHTSSVIDDVEKEVVSKGIREGKITAQMSSGTAMHIKKYLQQKGYKAVVVEEDDSISVFYKKVKQ